jgi:hypothetical protein
MLTEHFLSYLFVVDLGLLACYMVFVAAIGFLELKRHS